MAETELTRLARWAIDLRAEDVPADVLAAARCQVRSVLASVFAGAGDAAPARRAALALSTRGDATVLPTGERVAAFAAVLANASASMAHDFDDYVFMGHTGHSAVLAPLALGEEADATVGEVVTAVAVANEIAGRLGAFVALGPQNGQLWAHIHLGAAVVAAARLRGLDADACADALGIAFYQPPMTLWPGFMGSEAKIVTAAWPAAQGVFATELASQGMGGARAMLDHPRGFGHAFAFEALPQLLGGLGEAWVGRSMSIKPTPGCAYTTAPVHAALEAAGGDERDVKAVRIRASALTTGMEAMCEASVPDGSMAPIAINFSARRSVAVALANGALTPRALEPQALREHDEAIRRLLAATTLEEDRDMTIGVLEGLSRAVPLAGMVRELGAVRVARAARRMLGALGGGGLGRGGGKALPSAAGMRSLGAVLRSGGAFDLSEARFEELAFRFAAEVEVTFADGRTAIARCDVPPGAAGRGATDVDAVSRAKLRAEAPSHAETIEAALDDPSTPIRALTAGLTRSIETERTRSHA